MSFAEVYEPLERWSRAAHPAGVATLIQVRRSAPRPPGARFAANDVGELAGSVSSGCVEGDLYEHIQQVVKAGVPRVVEYGITDEMAMDVGLACGGEIEVLVAPYQPDNAVWPALARVLDAQSAAVLVTGLSEPIRGRQMLLQNDGALVGTLGDAGLDAAAARAAAPLLDTGGAHVVAAGDPAVELFAEGFLPPARLAIIGATPVAAALCHLASDLGIAVTLVDPREAFATDARFPDAHAIVREWPEKALDRIGLDHYWNVVVLAHDAKFDVPALDAALRAGCLYVGQIGGGRTQRLRREALKERGFTDQDLARIHGPVGLDIGAISPEEIALSILAELLAARRGKEA
jgi:xanthine dehydrogenase accessory factor